MVTTTYGGLMMLRKGYAGLLTAVWLLTAQSAAMAQAAAEEVPFGGDSLLPWVLIALTILSVVISAVWMKRGGRF
jgi:hypothetical protein